MLLVVVTVKTQMKTRAAVEYFGDILAFSASIGVAIYLTIAKRLRPKIDLVLFMFLVFSLSSVFLLIYITVCSGQQYEFSFDPSSIVCHRNGIFSLASITRTSFGGSNGWSNCNGNSR